MLSAWRSVRMAVWIDRLVYSNTAVLWNLESGEMIQTLDGHTEGIHCGPPSARDGRRVADRFL